MKKFFMCCAMMAAVSGGAMAQYQLTNNDFEGNWESCYPWEKGSKVTKAYGTTPIGWCVSNVPNSVMPLVAESTDGYSGKAVKLTNVSVMGQSAPGYITLGTTWATAEVKLLTNVRNADGGVFGGIAFSKHPDAIQLRYQRSISNGSERCSLVGYLWKGTWAQSDVPSNTAVGSLTSYGTATKVTMTNRDRNILNMETLTGGTVTPSADAELIASLESYQSEAKSSWTTWTAEFDYKTNSTPEMLNIVVSATDYFADRSGIVSDNYIMVDDVKLLYYSELTSGSFKGTPLTINANGTIEKVKDIYSEDKISLTSNGHGATIEKSYDEKTAILTVTVKGEDISENTDNFHTYTIQFAKKGDVNGDGEVTIADVTALVNIILGKNDKKAIADVNGDGPVTIADVTALVNIILGK